MLRLLKDPTSIILKIKGYNTHVEWYPTTNDGGSYFYGLVRGHRQQSGWFPTKRAALGRGNLEGSSFLCHMGLPMPPLHECARSP